MKGLLLISILIASTVIPVVASRDADPRRGAKRMLAALLAFNALYLVYLTVVHVTFFVPTR